MPRISLLGATGSIGQQTLDLIRAAPERYELHSIAAAGNNLPRLFEICQEFRPKQISLANEARLQELKDICPGDLKVDFRYGSSGLISLAAEPAIDIVILGVVGFLGLEPCLTALKRGKRVVIANKEPLVSAGQLINQAINEGRGQLIPADSEQVALHQCLRGGDIADVRKVYLTASGGPFWQGPADLSRMTPAQALKHPTWKMGAKITIDSATMMNKGLEVIEAHSLFGFEYDQIEVLIHPQSLVHGLVEYRDGSLIAQMAPNDMRLALQYALDYPHRQNNLSNQFLNPGGGLNLHFESPRLSRFPCLRLAYEAGRLGKSYPAVLNAANEIAVQGFLDQRIGFLEIAVLVEKILTRHQGFEIDSLETVLKLDAETRVSTASFIS